MTCRHLHQAIASLLFRDFTIEIGDIEWFDKAFRAVEVNSWQHVRRISLEIGIRINRSSQDIDWDAFKKYWNLFLRILPKSFSLQITDWDPGDNFDETLTNEIIQQIKTLIAAFQERQAKSLKSAHVKLHFPESQVTLQALALAENFQNVTLYIAGTLSMPYIELSDDEGHYGLAEEHHDSAMAIIQGFSDLECRTLQLFSWPATHLKHLHGPVRLTHLSLEEVDHRYFCDLRKCLHNLKDVLEHLSVKSFSYGDEDSSLVDVSCLQMARLRTLVIEGTDIEILPDIIQMLSSPSLQTIHFRQCLTDDDTADALQICVEDLQHNLADTSCTVSFDSHYFGDNYGRKPWMPDITTMSAWCDVLSHHLINLSLTFSLPKFRRDDAYSSILPSYDVNKIDNCSLDILFPMALWSHIQELYVDLDEKPNKSSRRQQVVRLSTLRRLQVTLKVDEARHCLKKLRCLLYGVDAPALLELELRLQGLPGLPLQEHVQLVASELYAFPSLDRIIVDYKVPGLKKETSKCLEEVCKEIGIDLRITHNMIPIASSR